MLLILSQCLFVLVIGELTKSIQEIDPWIFFFFFSNNIVLADKIKSRINVKLKIWWYALKSKWFGLSKTKIEYMECKFSKSINKNKGTARLDGQ